jgi:hypothetical protein
MSIIEDSLRQEEKFGGFEPQADDSFLLDKQEYEGEIPDFSQQADELSESKLEEQTTEPVAEGDGIDEAELIDASKTESIWDAFDEEGDDSIASENAPEEQETDDFEKAGILENEDEELVSEGDTEEIEDMPPEIIEEDEDEEELISEKEFEEDEDEEFVSEDTLEKDDDTPEKDDDTPEKDAYTFDDVQEDKETEDLMSDEDLTSFLTEELERSKKRKEQAGDQKTMTSDDAIETTSKSDFKAVDDADDVIEIDLSSFDIDSYSKKKATGDKQDKAVTPPIVAKKSEQKQAKVKKEKKERAAWIPFVAAAAIILLSLLIGGYYLYNYNGIFGIFYTSDSTLISENTQTHSDDSTALADDQLKEKDDEKTETIDEKEIEEPEEDLIEDQYVERVPEKQKPITRKNRDFRTVPKVKKQTKQTDDQTSEYQDRDIINHTKDLPFTLDDNERGVYTVQIYSTLSEDDAMDWLLKLKRKNITSAFISTQRIRDKVWYRVRFGAFPTKQDAKEAASRYGFAQSWIDRVK